MLESNRPLFLHPPNAIPYPMPPNPTLRTQQIPHAHPPPLDTPSTTRTAVSNPNPDPNPIHAAPPIGIQHQQRGRSFPIAIDVTIRLGALRQQVRRRGGRVGRIGGVVIVRMCLGWKGGRGQGGVESVGVRGGRAGCRVVAVRA